MKSFKNFILTIILTICFSFPLIWGTSKVFMPKWTDHDGNRMTYIIKGFYEESKNSLDILFMGNSDVYRGISPMELYDYLGITSYNFVSSGQRMWIAYPMMAEAIKYQKPKIIFFNVDEVFFTSSATSGNYHKVYDNMHFGISKIKGVFDPNYEKNILEKVSHFLPIFAYHSRYSELSWEDVTSVFKNYSDPTKGMDLVATVNSYENEDDYMQYTEELALIPDKNKKYLDQMVELCQKNDIELILLEIPSADSWNYKKSNAIKEYAKENDLKFLDLNLELETMDFDWSHDTSDKGDHLNIYGALKVTSYIADFLQENYEFASHKDDAKWNEQYQEYLKIKEMEINLND